MTLRACILLAVVCFAASAQAQSSWVDRIVAAHKHQTPVETDADLDPGAAVEIQRRVVAALRNGHGDIFGYKAGLTSPAAQERFNVDEPILGTLLAGMILDNDARVSVADGVNLMVEADLLVRVADPRINSAATPAEAFAAIDRVAAFVEIPDIIIAAGQPVTGPVLTAVNSGARYGVMGPVVDTGSLEMADLGAFTVRMLRNGEATGPPASGAALLGDPMNVVLWMAGEAKSRGITLAPGDWLSLGSLTAPVKARAGDRYVARYEGLGSGTLEVRLELVP